MLYFPHLKKSKTQYCFFILLPFFLLSCSIPDPLIDQIKDKGELLVVTRNSPTTYYEGRDGHEGFEHDLVQAFAKELGVKVRYVVPEKLEDLLSMVKRSEVHFAAAGLSITEKRKTLVRFSESYQKISAQLVYHKENKRPKAWKDIRQGSSLEVVALSSHEETLINLKKSRIPDLNWDSISNLGSGELLSLVNERLIDYTIADSNEVALSQRLNPNIKVGFNVIRAEKLAWAFPHSHDNSLIDAANAFIKRYKKEGELAKLIHRYYGEVEHFASVTRTHFRKHIRTRLPLYEEWFKKYGAEVGFDWKLLAAIGYQESRWNPKAVSPTGVKGLMMLTNATSKEMKVSNRVDPEQSIRGGAGYVAKMLKRMPARIKGDDRLWMALASYNVGFGHLLDARVLAQRAGKSPDKWRDVKSMLPLLAQKKYHKTVKHGYARGKEPVTYVSRIRRYYAMLQWYYSLPDEERIESQEKKKRENYPLSISPGIL